MIDNEILFLPFRIQAGCCASCMLPLLACFSPENPQAAVCMAGSAAWSHCEYWAVSQYVLSLVRLVFQRAALALHSEKSSSCWGLQTLCGREPMKCVSLCARGWLEVVLSGSRSRWCCAPRLLVNSCPSADSTCWCCCSFSCVLCHPCLVGRSVSLPPPFPLLSTHAWTQGPWALTPCSFSYCDGCWLLPADLVKVRVEKREWWFSG